MIANSERRAVLGAVCRCPIDDLQPSVLLLFRTRPGAADVVTVTDDAGRTVGAGEFLGTRPQEMRCNPDSSVLRADAALVQVTAPDGEVVLDARV